MKDFHKPILLLMAHYAEATRSTQVQRILAKASVDSDDEARALLAFLDVLCQRVAEDARRQVMVLNQPVHPADAETVCEVVQSYLEGAGYAHLLDQDPD